MNTTLKLKHRTHVQHDGPYRRYQCSCGQSGNWQQGINAIESRKLAALAGSVHTRIASDVAA